MSERNEASGGQPGLQGKVVVVTGAGRGQGAAEVRELQASGAHVIALDLTDVPAEDLGAADYHRADVTDPDAWTRLTTEIRERHGRVDGLVNNAGTTWRARLLEVAVEDFQRVHTVNVVGPLLAIQHCVPLMPAGSSIVNVGSVAALTGHVPVAYTASKWAFRGLTKVAALELGPAGIRVNAVHPGYIETPMTVSAAPGFRGANVAETPLGRTGTVDEVAGVVAFLLSDRSAFVSGAEIAVDGGMTGHGGVKSVAAAMAGGVAAVEDGVDRGPRVPYQRQ